MHEASEPVTGPASLLSGCFRMLLAASLHVNSRGRKRGGRRPVREGLKQPAGSDGDLNRLEAEHAVEGLSILQLLLSRTIC